MIRHSLVFFLALFSPFAIVATSAVAQRIAHSSTITAPISIYSEDPAFTSASTNSESRALHEVDELVRLKSAGVHFDYDLIDAPAFGADSPTLRAENWPDGTRMWIERCHAAGVRPGLRIDGSSLAAAELTRALQTWYDRGIRLFDFNALNVTSAKFATNGKFSPEKTAEDNAAALRDVLQAFRDKNHDAVLLVSSAEHDARNAIAVVDFASHVDAARLGEFTIPLTESQQLAEIPEANVWRSIDIQRDATVRRFEQAGIPLAQIESAGFTASGAADSALHAWKSEFLLSMARGGWVNSVHGDLGLIEQNDARWMARVQKVFLGLQGRGQIHSFGGAAGSGEPYGFAGANARGAVYVVVNPSGKIATMVLPQSATGPAILGAGRVQFRDDGYVPRLNGNAITLGPGQMAMVGYGAYSAHAYGLGVEQDVVIPHSIEELDADFHSSSPGALDASLNPPIEGVLRVIVRPRQGDTAGTNNVRGGRSFTMDATQSGRPIPVRLDEGNVEAGAPSWVVGEVDVNDLTPGVPVLLHVHAGGPHPADLEGSAYAVVD